LHQSNVACSTNKNNAINKIKEKHQNYLKTDFKKHDFKEKKFHFKYNQLALQKLITIRVEKLTELCAMFLETSK